MENMRERKAPNLQRNALEKDRLFAYIIYYAYLCSEKHTFLMAHQRKHYSYRLWGVVLCFCCLLGLPLSSFANIRLTKSQHLVSSNDTIIRYEIQGVCASDSGRACVWDFSAATVLPLEHPTIYRLSANSLSFSSHFLHTRNKYRLVADTLFCTGYETASMQVNFVRWEKVIVYPFAYQDTLYDTFSGYGEYTHTIPFYIQGTSVAVADGVGTLRLPDMTFDSVLRIHTQRQYRQINTDTTHIQYSIYQWYHPECQYPIIELIDCLHILRADSTRLSFGLYYPFDKDTTSQNTSDTPKAKEIISAIDIVTDIETMPNPVFDQLQIRYTLAKDAQVGFSLHYEGGLCAYRSDAKPQNAGIHLQSIDMSRLPKGIYVLYIYADEQVLSKDILKL